jgi:epoxyqueuosine reductase
MSLADDIKNKAMEIGIPRLGIIRTEVMEGYGQRVRERLEVTPKIGILKEFLEFSAPKKRFPWAKSIVVAAFDFTGYGVSKVIGDYYGKHYLFDYRLNPSSPEAIKINRLGRYLRGLGLQTAYEERRGVTALRWAAMSAGLGIIRRNNFFYTENGSYNFLTAFIIDAKTEFLAENNIKPCPEDCDLCRRACPTLSLSAPYVMDIRSCVSFLTTFNTPQTFDKGIKLAIGSRVYGCDSCQDACPFNRNRFGRGTEIFPGLPELEPLMDPNSILAMDYQRIAETLAVKFFYLDKDHLWRWKYNALNSLEYQGLRPSQAVLERLLTDPHPVIQAEARSWLEE